MAQQLEFNIESWTAWAPSLQDNDSWSSWFLQGMPDVDSEAVPQLNEIPAMKRRRLSMFAKMAVEVAMQLIGNRQIETVFSSRHGDLHKTSLLLENIARKEDLSPTQFGLSVHNAAAGQFHIYMNNKAASNTVSAGKNSFVMGLIDAVCRISQAPNDQVLYVFVDQPKPELFSEFRQEPCMPIAFAALLNRKEVNNCKLIQSRAKGVYQEQVIAAIHGLLNKSSTELSDSGWTLQHA